MAARPLTDHVLVDQYFNRTKVTREVSSIGIGFSQLGRRDLGIVLCCGRSAVAELAHRRLHRKASKKQMSTRPETLEVAKYVVVFTTCRNASTVQILEW